MLKHTAQAAPPGAVLCLGKVGSVVLPLQQRNPTLREVFTKIIDKMKKFLQLFALMAVFLTGSLAVRAGAVLTYDFMTRHPATNICISDGYAELVGSYNFWKGNWSYLFGGKIAFATDSYPVLRNVGGLVDYHDARKMYVLGLSAGDKVKFVYTGANGRVEYLTSGTARLSGLSASNEQLVSGQDYTVSVSGDLCVQTRWTQDTQVTIINSIVIETNKTDETISMPYGMRTYCSNNPLNFSGKRSIKAYLATGFRDGKFVFEQVTYVPARTGFLLVRRGNTTSFDVHIGRSSDYKDNIIGTNLFTGLVSAASIPNDGADHYVVGHTSNGENIFKVQPGFQCKTKTAYLTVSE